MAKAVGGRAKAGRAKGELEASSDGVEPAEDEDEPLTEFVSRHLREEIVTGRLQPGQRIVQDAVARTYGTSRIPVREALRELASEGLVTIEPDVGARVAMMDLDDLMEVFMMREKLEPLAIRESVPRLTPVQVDELRALLEESERCADDGHVERYLDLDYRFHEGVVAGSPRLRLNRVVKSLWNAARQYRRAYMMRLPPYKFEIAVAEHRFILEALDRGAAEDAALVMELHIRRTREALAAHAEWFEPAAQGPPVGQASDQ